jgi:hypothetical protein
MWQAPVYPTSGVLLKTAHMPFEILCRPCVTIEQNFEGNLP